MLATGVETIAVIPERLSSGNVALVGLGNIGVGYDFDEPLGTSTLSHASAVWAHAFFNLSAGVDVDAANRARFEAKFEVAAYSGIEQIQEMDIDVVVIAAPTLIHHDIVIETLACLRPRIILLEKPIAQSSTEGLDIVAACTVASCDLFINFQRAVSPAIVDLQRQLADGTTALPIAGSAWYSNGLFNNGSHLVALLQQLLGPSSHAFHAGDVHEVRIRSGANDYNADCCFVFGDCAVWLHSAGGVGYERFALELLTPDSAIMIGGRPEVITLRKTQPDVLYPGCTVLGDPSLVSPIDPINALTHVYNALRMHMTGEPTTLITGAEALQVQRALEKAIENHA